MSDYIAKNIIVSMDFDGTIGHGLKVKLKYAKKWFNVKLKLHQTKKGGFEALMEKLGRKDINYRTLMDPINEKHIMEYKVPFHCKKVLSKLYSEGFRFVVVSSRNDHDYPCAVKFIKHSFPGLIKYIHNTRNEPKGKFIERLKPRIHIDDDLPKLEQIKHSPIELVYYRQPENRHKNSSDSRIIGVRKWKKFYSFCHYIRELHEAICWYYRICNRYNSIQRIYNIKKRLSIKQQQKLIDLYRDKKHNFSPQTF